MAGAGILATRLNALLLGLTPPPSSTPTRPQGLKLPEPPSTEHWTLLLLPVHTSDEPLIWVCVLPSCPSGPVQSWDTRLS